MLVYGDCQGGWLSHRLATNPEVSSRFEIIYLTDYHARPRNHVADTPGFWGTCSVLIW